jgi:lipopolysaccharide export system permease protein
MLLFTAIAVAVDSSEKTDDFVKSGLTTAQIIREYYFGFIPYIWGLLYPLFVFIAVIFFYQQNGPSIRGYCHFSQWYFL